jgi:hypothetical protein
MRQELLTLQGHMRSLSVFGVIRVAHLFSFLCCVFVLSVFVLCLMCPMLSVSLDCLCPVSYMPKVASFFGLSIADFPSLTFIF